MAADPERLSRRARDLVETTEHELLLSVASAWEIAIKHGLGKLKLPASPADYVPSRMERLRTISLPIEQSHALRVSLLPLHHRDPFDRLLVAQAQLEDLPILTADTVFSRYDVEVIDARFNDVRR
jgi:PIN domain nuclease of toxin-antitoxin system